MSTSHDAEPHVHAEIDPVDIDRLRVAAHQVLRWTEEGGADDPDIARVALIRHHAGTLVDLGTEAAHPFAATRSHALIVRNELIEIGTERSLTLAVWFDDALGLGARGGEAIRSDPAERGTD
jgi:hypothetical protein